ncbi:MAG: TonB-dependent receptor plug domain-containing protein [Ignavibacteria bacterium]|nr:TonB-dependent receptor plug domain-containing protein [Ignavibacteria bacterium]
MRLLFSLLVVFALVYSMSTAQTTVKRSKPVKDSTRVYIVPSVTVTSTRADEATSPVPFAEITRAELKDRYTAQDMPALIADLPSAFYYSDNGNGIGYSYLKMRGFDQRRIAVMINGIPQNDPEDHNVYWIDVPDAASNMQSIQVQRGAGLINYGAAAIGGSINLTTTNFTDSRFIRVSSGIGYQQFGANDKTILAPITSKFGLEVSSGLTGKYAFYGRLSRINSDGYRANSWAELSSYFLSAARFDEDVTTQINIFGGPIADGLAYNGLPKQYITDLNLRRSNFNAFDYDSTGTNLAYTSTRRAQEIENFSQPHYEMLNDWFISENLTLKSALFYYIGTGFFDYDGSWADAATLRMIPEYGFRDSIIPGNALIRGAVENRHGGWIPRLVWNHQDGDLTIGAEFRLHKSYHYGKVQFAENLPAGLNPDFHIYDYNGGRSIFSVFGQEQYQLSEKTWLNIEAQLVQHTYIISNEKAGGRYTRYATTSGTISGEGDLFNVKYLFLNPRLGILHTFSDEINAYASIAITSREPRMRNLYAAEDSYFGAQPLFTLSKDTLYDFTQPLVQPERMIDFELGGRYKSVDGKYALGVNAFLMEFSNELVKSGRLDIFGNPVDGNAPRSRHYGIELDGTALLADMKESGKLELSGNISISQNRFVEYDYYLNATQKISLNDQTIAGFPDVLANIRLSYRSGGLHTSVLFKHVGAFYSDNFGDKLSEYRTQFPGITSYADNRADAYSIVNIDLAYEFTSLFSLESLRIHTHCTNVLNALYAANAEGKEFYPAAERGFYFGIDLGL